MIERKKGRGEKQQQGEKGAFVTGLNPVFTSKSCPLAPDENIRSSISPASFLTKGIKVDRRYQRGSVMQRMRVKNFTREVFLWHRK